MLLPCSHLYSLLFLRDSGRPSRSRLNLLSGVMSYIHCCDRRFINGQYPGPFQDVIRPFLAIGLDHLSKRYQMVVTVCGTLTVTTEGLLCRS